jgi:hypothetical protein
MAKEICIICDQRTLIDVDTDIDLRDFYIEGAGQLCNRCGIEYLKTINIEYLKTLRQSIDQQDKTEK